MSNTIKLKRGSGSDPSASDLSVGEVALRTDSGKLFTKKDDNSIAEIGGGSDAIDDGAVTNAKVASDAAIAGTKISPDFGSQNIITTGQIKVDGDGGSKYISVGDNEDFKIYHDASGPTIFSDPNNQGLKISAKNLNFTEYTGTTTRFRINDDGHVDVTGNLDVGAGLDVTGAINSTGVITTTGNELVIQGNNPTLIFSESNGNPDFKIMGDAGKLSFHDTTNDVTRIAINADGHVDVAGNLDVGAGIDVTGQITASSHIKLPDSAELKLGSANNGDFNLLHDGTDSILNNATGHLLYRSATHKLQALDATDRLVINSDGDIDIGGNLKIVSDTLKLFLGASEEMQVFHDGTSSLIKDTRDSGKVRIQADNFDFIDKDASAVILNATSSGLGVAGNISVTGTVDGVDVAALNTAVSGLSSGSAALTNGVTATTQSASDNSTKVATTAYTDTAIANLVDSSPSTLNTLNELAAALGDDANFSTTVTNSIATKLPLAGGTLTGALNITDNSATGLVLTRNSQTIKLDANYGNGGDQAVLASASLRFYSNGTSERMRILASNGNVGIANTSPSQKLDVTGNIAVSGTVDGRDIATDGTKLDGIESGATADQTVTEIKSLIAGSPLGATHIATDAIGSAELAANAVTSAHIAANTITAADIATDAVGSAEIAADAVTGDHIANDSIDSEHYVDGSIDTAFIADDAVTFAKIENIATGGIMGRNNSGTGSIERLTASEVRTLINVENGATADQSNSEIKTAYEANSDTNAFTDALLSKLNGIAASATNVTNNNQLTNGAGYSTFSGSYNDLSNKPTIPTNNNQLSNGAGYVTSSGNTVIGTDSDINTSGATVIDQLNMTDGVIQSHSTRTITLADLGYTGATNANNITNNNQLSNGAGYLTSVSSGNINNDAVTNDKIAEYEEGDWTPSLLGGSNGAGGYSIRDGSYVKIGRMVHVNFGMAITSKGSMSGDLNVGSLPFTVQHIINDTSIEASGICGYWKHVDPNSSTLTLVAEQDSNIFVRHTVGPEDDPDQMSSSHIDSDFTIRGSITYFTSQ